MRRSFGIRVPWLQLALLLSCLGLVSASWSATVEEREWGVVVLELGNLEDDFQEHLALRKCLNLLGIPYRTTEEAREAVKYQLILISGVLRNDLSSDDLESLYAYVERGGTLFATQVHGSAFFPLFGITDSSSSRTNFRVKFDRLEEPILRYLNRPEERTVSLGDPNLYSETIWSTEYTPGLHTQVLARYENGASALTLHPYGRGLAFALGPGFKETTMIPQLARGFEAARQWINSFEPSGDSFRLLLRGLYEETVHPFLLIHTIPDGNRTALVLSHDVDARESFRNSLTFAEMEKSLGVRSTFFVTTKYFADENDIGYYDAERVQWIQKVRKIGFEIGSHSVSHSLIFDEFPVGDASVAQNIYRPGSPTVFGEVQVSKELLKRDIGNPPAGFRAGYLRYPSDLLRVLERSGYKYDSSVSAQFVLTNFPYFGYRQRKIGAPESNIVVVPVTLDDSRDFLTAVTMEKALQTWTDIIEANGENNAITCLLIHPTNTAFKLETERRLIKSHLGKDIWIGDVGTIAQFWRERSRLQATVKRIENGQVIIGLNVLQNNIPPGQTLILELPSDGRSPLVVDAINNQVRFEIRSVNGKLFLHLK